MNYLEEKIDGRLGEIIAHKQAVLASRRAFNNSQTFNIQSADNFQKRDFAKIFDNNRISLIAEIKKASPSAGNINLKVGIVNQARQYEASGARAISVLTDEKFFRGKLEDLSLIKKAVSVPVLRKDFIFDPEQIYESRHAGADAILLMATILTKDGLKELLSLAHELGLDCLVEVHTKAELQKALQCEAKIIGINARDLKTFEIDLQNIIDLAPLVPAGKILVGESGIKNKADVTRLQQVGVQGILVGTTLMQAENVDEKIKELIG